jgi:hypothetical protein
MGRVDWDRAPTARDVDDHRAEVEAEKVRQAEVRQELLAEAEVRQELLAEAEVRQELDAWLLEDRRRRQELLAEAEVRQELDVSGLCAVSYLLPLAAKSFDEGLDSQ